MVTYGGYVDAVSRYNEAFKALQGSSLEGSAMFEVLKQFNAEDRRVIAGRLYEVLNFEFGRPSIQELMRRNLRALSPDADLSWIPDWRKDHEALLAST